MSSAALLFCGGGFSGYPQHMRGFLFLALAAGLGCSSELEPSDPHRGPRLYEGERQVTWARGTDDEDVITEEGQLFGLEVRRDATGADILYVDGPLAGCDALPTEAPAGEPYRAGLPQVPSGQWTILPYDCVGDEGLIWELDSGFAELQHTQLRVRMTGALRRGGQLRPFEVSFDGVEVEGPLSD